jgi:XTP/dITP diphosphohydrolase
VTIRRLVIATHNVGKAKEIRILLEQTGLEMLSLEGFKGVSEAQETEDSYAGNAIVKARHYAAETNEWVLADDSGLEVAALNGAPGVLSARYAGSNASDEDRRRKLLEELASIFPERRDARFVCAVALAKPNQEIVKVTNGICEGVICETARGDSGFGYDPIFVPNGYNQTFGELAHEVKNQISHRARAIVAMRSFLLGEGNAA